MAVEEIKPYDSSTGKGQQVERMFDTIAPAYDLMNHAMTFRLDRRWRNKAIDILRRRMSAEGGRPGRNPQILDVACGTGDVTFALRRRLDPCIVTGADLSAGMLACARAKLSAPAMSRYASTVSFLEADCMALPFPDASFDAVTVAYGVRNFEHLDRGYAEMLRVLRPGGVICVLELCEPTSAAVRLGYRAYSRGVIPVLGRLVSGDRKAYSYLLESIRRCPSHGGMTALMERCGFASAQCSTLFPGTVAVYTATRPD